MTELLLCDYAGACTNKKCGAIIPHAPQEYELFSELKCDMPRRCIHAPGTVRCVPLADPKNLGPRVPGGL